MMQLQTSPLVVKQIDVLFDIERAISGRLEHFPTIWNHEGFQFWRYSDSRYGLVEEASLYGEISFDGSTRTA